MRWAMAVLLAVALLAIIAQSAPLLGLLGTIVGMARVVLAAQSSGNMPFSPSRPCLRARAWGKGW